MISNDSVIALNTSFVTVGRLLPNQPLRGVERDVRLLAITRMLESAIKIETDSFSIITSPQQIFIVSPTELLEARFLTDKDYTLTVDGFEPIVNIERLYDIMPMAEVYTDAGIFISEGFYLLSH